MPIRGMRQSTQILDDELTSDVKKQLKEKLDLLRNIEATQNQINSITSNIVKLEKELQERKNNIKKLSSEHND